MIVIGRPALDTKYPDLGTVFINHFRFRKLLTFLDWMIMNDAKQIKQLGQGCFSFPIMLKQLIDETPIRMLFDEIKKEQIMLVEQQTEIFQHQFHHSRIWETDKQFQCILEMIMSGIFYQHLK